MHVTKSDDRSRKIEAKIEENLFFAGAKAQDQIWRCEKCFLLEVLLTNEKPQKRSERKL